MDKWQERIHQRPDAILFDLFETLITEYEPVWTPSPTIAEQLGVDESAFSEAWSALSERRMTGALPSFGQALREICDSLGHKLDEQVIEQLFQERLSVKTQPFARLEHDILTMIRHLNNRSVKLSVLSNAASEEVAAWSESTLAPFFEDAVFSYQVGLTKPNEQIYLLACQRIGVSPSKTWFVGDGGSDELVGAAQAGLTPYWAPWYLDRWPQWKMSARLRGHAGFFPSLHRPNELIDVMDGIEG